MALASWTNQQVIDQLDSGRHWSGSLITYAFPTNSAGIYGQQGESIAFAGLNTLQKAQAELALALWDDLIVPTLVQTSGTANIEYGMTTTGIQYAHAYQPSVGSVWFNSSYSDLVTPLVGRHGFLTYIHETGHALGLDHMGSYNGSGSWTPSSYQDSGVYSVMSYFGPNMGSGSNAGEGLVAWADWIGADGQRYSPQTPMVNDILVMQTMYGADPTTRTGDTTYGFACNISGSRQKIFDFTVNLNPILSIYDAAGTDTLNLSGWSTESTVNLAPGAYSSCNSMTYNIAIAWSCTIENAVGGSAGDSLTGNSVGNRLDGGAGDDVLNGLDGDDSLIGAAGDDTLSGGNGDDWVYFSGVLDSYTISFNEAGQTYTVSSAATGSDLLSGIEYFVFGDGVARTGGQLIGQTLDGSAGADTLSGAAGDDVISAFDGRDRLYGASGADRLDGGSGIDSMYGGAGDDIYYVDHGSDLVVELSGIYGGVDEVRAAVTYALPGYVERLLLTGTAVINATGNSLANRLTGNSGDNILDGKVGVDTFVGGAGNDTYVVDLESELANITELSGEGSDTLRVTYANKLTTAKTLSLDGGLAELENITVTGNGLYDLIGSASANLLVGNSAGNRISGGDGNDTLNGGAGIDALEGGVGDDVYVVDNLHDTVTEAASAGRDRVDLMFGTAGYIWLLGSNVEDARVANSTATRLIGNDLDNALQGGSGSDWLEGGAGADTLTGGGGRDTYVVDIAGDVIVETVTLASEIDTVLAALSWTLGQNLETLRLSGTADLDGSGNALANALYGNAGNNRLDGGSGADTMLGFAGDDVYVVDNLKDSISEATVSGGSVDAGGNDTVESNITWTLGRYLENLTLTGGLAINATGNTLANVLTGNAASNMLNGLQGDDTMAGGAGDDVYVVDSVADVIQEAANAGRDTVNVLITSAGASFSLGAEVEEASVLSTAAIHLLGNAIANRLTGNAAANRLEGLDGDDYLDGKGGGDTLIGGDGDDVYVVDNLGDILVEGSGEGRDRVDLALSVGARVYTLAANIDDARVTNTQANGLVGNALGNSLLGNAAANYLDGGSGADTLEGGAGNDTYVVDNLADVIVETSALVQEKELVIASVSWTLAANLENLQLSGSAGIDGTGNALANLLTGNAAANRLDGAAGADTMLGMAGDDVYVVDNVADRVYETITTSSAADAGGTDTVISTLSWTLGSFVENLILAGSADINAAGNSQNNVLTGNAGNNVLNGNSGSDTMNGGAGDDTYLVDNVADVIGEAAGGGNDIARVGIAVNGATYVLGDYVETALIVSGAAINVVGNGQDNTLTGNALANVLNGGEGNDTLSGGVGNDTLFGGGGSDRFMFNAMAAATNVERIGDFEHGSDLIVLDSRIYSALGGAGNLSAEAFFVGSGLTGLTAATRIVYNEQSGELYYDVDGSAGKVAVRMAVLTGVPTLSADDFLIV